MEQRWARVRLAGLLLMLLAPLPPTAVHLGTADEIAAADAEDHAIVNAKARPGDLDDAAILALEERTDHNVERRMRVFRMRLWTEDLATLAFLGGLAAFAYGWRRLSAAREDAYYAEITGQKR